MVNKVNMAIFYLVFWKTSDILEQKNSSKTSFNSERSEYQFFWWEWMCWWQIDKSLQIIVHGDVNLFFNLFNTSTYHKVLWNSTTEKQRDVNGTWTLENPARRAKTSNSFFVLSFPDGFMLIMNISNWNKLLSKSVPPGKSGITISITITLPVDGNDW